MRSKILLITKRDKSDKKAKYFKNFGAFMKNLSIQLETKLLKACLGLQVSS